MKSPDNHYTPIITMNNTCESYPALHAEVVRTERGAEVILTQPGDLQQTSYRVTLHPVQLGHLAATFGHMYPSHALLDEVTQTLARRIDTLRFHIDIVYEAIHKLRHHDQDVSWVAMKTTTLLEMAEEFCSDLPLNSTGRPDKPAPAGA